MSAARAVPLPLQLERIPQQIVMRSSYQLGRLSLRASREPGALAEPFNSGTACMAVVLSCFCMRTTRKSASLMMMMMIDRSTQLRSAVQQCCEGDPALQAVQRGRTHSCTEVAATQVAEGWTKTQRLKGCSSLINSMVDGKEKVHESSCAGEAKTQVGRRGCKFPSSWHSLPGWVRTRDGHIGKAIEAHARLAEGTAFSNSIYLHVQSASPQKTS